VFRCRAVHSDAADGWSTANDLHELGDGLPGSGVSGVCATHGQPGGHARVVPEHLDERIDLVEVRYRLDRQEVGGGRDDHLEALRMEVDEPLTRDAIRTPVFTTVMANGSEGTNARSHEGVAPRDGVTRDSDRRPQGGIGIRLRTTHRDEPFAGHLVARRDDDAGTGIDVGLVNFPDLVGRVGEDAGRPERVAEIMSPGLEFGGETSVESLRALAEEIVDGDQM
jgi:hypothetical protein